MINSALSAPDSLSASRIATRSDDPAPTEFIVSTIVDSDTPGSNTNALAGSLTIPLSLLLLLSTGISPFQGSSLSSQST